MNDRPRVLHVVDKFAVSGETYVYDQVRLASATEATLLGERRVRGTASPGVTASTWRPVLPPLAERVVGRLGRAWDRPYLVPFQRFVEREAAAFGADLLHAHFGMMAWKLLDVQRRTGLPMVVTFYGVDVSHCLVDPYWRPRIEQVVAAADRCIVLCEEAAERLVAIGCPPERTRVWDIGIPLDEYPWSARPEAATRLLTVARFVEKKGHRDLLRAFRTLVDQRPDLRLTLIGNGPLRGAIEEQVAELDLGHAVSVVDTTGEPDFFGLFKRALAEHDLFVLPSVVAPNGDDEGGPPVVITNAMAAGLPVVSTPVGGIGRAIVDGVSGVLCPPGDPDALAAAVLDLVDDPDRRRGIAEQARLRVEDRFDLHKQIDALERLQGEVVDGAPSRRGR